MIDDDDAMFSVLYTGTPDTGHMISTTLIVAGVDQHPVSGRGQQDAEYSNRAALTVSGWSPSQQQNSLSRWR